MLAAQGVGGRGREGGGKGHSLGPEKMTKASVKVSCFQPL